MLPTIKHLIEDIRDAVEAVVMFPVALAVGVVVLAYHRGDKAAAQNWCPEFRASVLTITGRMGITD